MSRVQREGIPPPQEKAFVSPSLKSYRAGENRMKIPVRLWLKSLLLVSVIAGCCSGADKVVNSGTAADTTPPSVPISLAATAAGASRIDLSWTGSTDNVGVTGYKIYRWGIYIRTVATTTTPDTGLTRATNYCYTVSAIDAANNESTQSTQTCATTSDATTGLVPDTGQTTHYASIFGDDSDYPTNPPSYTDNGNGTIMDNVTGLMWQKQDDGILRAWDAAVAYCSGSTLGGFSGWRLPTVFELVTIVDFGRYGPSINSTYFPSTSPSGSSGYWSSNDYATDTASAWSVVFYNGFANHGFKTSPSNYARCVR
jgi:hypothetical protein